MKHSSLPFQKLLQVLEVPFGVLVSPISSEQGTETAQGAAAAHRALLLTCVHVRASRALSTEHEKQARVMVQTGFDKAALSDFASQLPSLLRAQQHPSFC